MMTMLNSRTTPNKDAPSGTTNASVHKGHSFFFSRDKSAGKLAVPRPPATAPATPATSGGNSTHAAEFVLNVVENEMAMVVRMAVPGFHARDISVDYKAGGVLSIVGCREDTQGLVTRFQRSITSLPPRISFEHSGAELSGSQLTITLAKQLLPGGERMEPCRFAIRRR